ncbi:MAG: prepilin-type N-terminal cleavage/methylation domain-containing protein [Pirellulales bacterium]|nr:prepilin-type N-terminal cleavage/methylation domain-containing protein [Pirellulales bacterium]
MKPPIPPSCRTGCQPVPHRGYTLIEILVATALALLLMTTVVALVGNVGESVTESRAVLESADRLRLAETRLQKDLAGLAAPVCPVLKPEDNEGYFEYIEGPATSIVPIAVNFDNGGQLDTTVGDFDDILMFTTRTTGKPFVGRFGSGGATIESNVAEVAWFLRGRNLHRRVLLVAPDQDVSSLSAQGFYAYYDISARVDLSTNTLRANTLGDLTRRERRFAHPQAVPNSGNTYFSWTVSGAGYTFPTLPTLDECSTSWSTERTDTSATALVSLDLWTNVSGHRVLDNAFGSSGLRVSDDIILTNVIGFDVKAWDPVAADDDGDGVSEQKYRDLGHGYSSSTLGLGHLGQSFSPLAATSNSFPRVYDTWSTSYYGSNWNDGFDDDSDGIVDEDDEKTNPPPYPIPLRGIQVKIRVFEPDSRQIREVTVVQEFLPQ